MTRNQASKTRRLTLGILTAAAAAMVGGCAGGGGGDADYSMGVYYGSAWGPSPWYYGGTVYVGPPPATRPEHAVLSSWAGDLRDALAVLDSVTRETVVLLGHSKGGGIMLELADAAPHRARALVNLDGLPSKINWPDVSEHDRTRMLHTELTGWLDQFRNSPTFAAADIPLVGRVPSLPETPPNTRVLLEMGEIDLLDLDFDARHVANVEAAA